MGIEDSLFVILDAVQYIGILVSILLSLSIVGCFALYDKVRKMEKNIEYLVDHMMTDDEVYQIVEDYKR